MQTNTGGDDTMLSEDSDNQVTLASDGEENLLLSHDDDDDDENTVLMVLMHGDEDNDDNVLKLDDGEEDVPIHGNNDEFYDGKAWLSEDDYIPQSPGDSEDFLGVLFDAEHAEQEQVDVDVKKSRYPL